MKLKQLRNTTVLKYGFGLAQYGSVHEHFFVCACVCVRASGSYIQTGRTLHYVAAWQRHAVSPLLSHTRCRFGLRRERSIQCSRCHRVSACVSACVVVWLQGICTPRLPVGEPGAVCQSALPVHPSWLGSRCLVSRREMTRRALFFEAVSI